VAVYTLLNDILARVVAGERVAMWVLLEPQGTKRRFYQCHHPFTLSDGRLALLIEAQAEPPAEEMLVFASNSSLVLGLYERSGELVSGNPAFQLLLARPPMSGVTHTLASLDALLGVDWFTQIAEIESAQSLPVERELNTERGPRWFRAELRSVHTNLGEIRVIVSLFDITDERIAEAERAHRATIEQSLREKETLLREIHHRVKNNLQIISSLLMLQRDLVPNDDARRMLAESVFRVRSMALVHQQLYGVDSLERVELGAYARSLAESLRASLAPTAQIVLRADVAEVTVERAVPCALILNELITNAMKYGQPVDGRQARVEIEIVAEAQHLCLQVTDAGPGFPPGVDVSTAGTLGLQLVRSLTRQLRGVLTVDSPGGARVSVRWPRLG
jgi:two-component sensor histidine kinase